MDIPEENGVKNLVVYKTALLSELEQLYKKYFDNESVLNKLDFIIELLNQQKNAVETFSDKAILENILNKQKSNDDLLVQYLKLNAEFQQQVRINMNKENEQLKMELLGERLDPVLKSIATVYCEYYHLLSVEIEDKKYQNKVSYLLESLEDILLEYGCNIEVTESGKERSPRTTKIKQPIVLTDDPSLHRTVITSFNPSISKGKKVLYPEYVSIYKYNNILIKEEENLNVDTDEKIEAEEIDNINILNNEEGEK